MKLIKESASLLMHKLTNEPTVTCKYMKRLARRAYKHMYGGWIEIEAAEARNEFASDKAAGREGQASTTSPSRAYAHAHTPRTHARTHARTHNARTGSSG